MRALVFGASGFAGTHLLGALAERGAELFAADCRVPESSPPGSPDARWYPCDVRDPRAVRHALEEARPDAIYYLAAVASPREVDRDPATALAVNAGGAASVVEAAPAGCRVLLISSSQVYGPAQGPDPVTEDAAPRPTSAYAISKRAMELMAGLAGPGREVIVARPTNHFGPGQSPEYVVASLARQIARAEEGGSGTIQVGSLDAQRDFLPVESVVQAYLALAEQGEPGQAYNVASGVLRPVRALLQQLQALSRAPVEVKVAEDRVRREPSPSALSSQRLQDRTGWRPPESLAPALERTLEHWRREVRLERNR